MGLPGPDGGSPERRSHDAAVARTLAGAGVVVVHAQVMAHLVGQRGADGDGTIVVILEKRDGFLQSAQLHAGITGVPTGVIEQLFSVCEG